MLRQLSRQLSHSQLFLPDRNTYKVMKQQSCTELGSPQEQPKNYWPRGVKIDVRFLTGKIFSTYLPQGSSLCVLSHVTMKSLGMTEVESLRFRDSNLTQPVITTSYANIKSLFYAAISAIGGKGGFGQILRAKGKNSTQQTTNFDSCRTLNGPRVGIQRQLKAIELWGKGEDNADELTRLAVGSIAAAKAHRDSRSRRGYETKELSAKEKAELREQQVREGFEDQLKETSRRVSGTLKALSAGLKKKHEHGISYCLEGHPLQSVLVGLGKNETGFDWNACDECDEICEQQVHRCAICDFDICCACRDALVKEASQVDTVQPKKKKKKKSSAFDHGLSEDSSNESDD